MAKSQERSILTYRRPEIEAARTGLQPAIAGATLISALMFKPKGMA